MRIPEGYTEEQVVSAINKCSDILSSQFRFGYYDEDDIRQECFVEAIKLLNKGKFDSSRPLENYLFRHLKRRCLNLWRDKKMRADAPCRICHTGEGCENGQFCRKYQIWHKRNSDKSNLLKPMPIQDDEKLVDSIVEAAAQTEEFQRKLDEHLTVEQRALWRKLLDGVTVPKKKRMELYEVIRDIIQWEENHK